jgi:uncharacterized protein YlxP (DUF503 family)
MLVGTLRVDLFLPDASSLKEKRYALQSLKTKIRNRFNVSVAEVDFQDKWQRAELGAACVSSDRKVIEGMLNGVLELIEKDTRVEVTDRLIEIL